MTTQHLYLCQTPDVAERVASLGYDAEPWDAKKDPVLHRDRSLILVPHHEEDAAFREVYLIAEQAADAGAAAVRVLEYPARPYIGPGYNLSLEGEPYDYLARKLLDHAQDQEPLRLRVPDLVDLNIADQFAGEPPVQRWLVGSPTGQGGLLPDAAPILLAGRGGIGKTHAATELAFLVGTWDGSSPAPRWMGQEIAKAGPTVVITYEEHKNSMHRKIRKLCDHHGIDIERGRRSVMVLSMSDPRVCGGPLIGPHPRTKGLAATEEYTRLTRQLRKVRQQFGELGAIVLDHVGKAFPVEGNSYNDANAAMGLTDRWSAEFACPVIAIAHTKKVVVTADMGDEELLQAVMGSAGWVSAVRATMVMWQFEENEEAKIAEAVGDADFVPGTTRRKYVRAQVLKHNVDDVYEGRLTLCRRGAGLDDLSAGIRKAHRDKRIQEMEGLASAIAAQWDRDTPMQSSGKEGVFEKKDRLGLPWSAMSKSNLRALVKDCVKAGLLVKVKEHPAHPRLTQGDWLRPAGHVDLTENGGAGFPPAPDRSTSCSGPKRALRT